MEYSKTKCDKCREILKRITVYVSLEKDRVVEVQGICPKHGSVVTKVK